LSLSAQLHPTMSATEIRDLSVEEADLAATFFHEKWRPNHIFFRNRELLLWQYYRNPYGVHFSGGLTFKAAFEEGRNVGVFAYMPFAFNCYGMRKFGCHLSAWWVHPEHRRGPLALRLLHCLQDKSSFDACISGINTAVAERLYERMSWVVVRNIPRLVYIVDKARFETLLDPATAIPDPAATAVRPAHGAGGSNTTGGNKIELELLTSFERLRDLGWDAFYWQRIAHQHMGPAREAVYLEWRYGNIPVFHYDGLLAKRSGEISGLLVYRIEQIKNSEQQIIRLVDVIAEPEAIPDLVNGVVEVAVEQRATAIDFFCTHPTYLAQLLSCGFIDACDSGGERYWCPHLFQPLDRARNRLNSAWWIRGMDLQAAAARSEFCIMKGDYEFDRPN
jgi:hypothetical protein